MVLCGSAALCAATALPRRDRIPGILGYASQRAAREAKNRAK